MTKHTIVLYQTKPADATRKWAQFLTVDKALDGICQLFEAHLKHAHPDQRRIEYGIDDLYTYIDSLPDLSALVYAPEINAYQPRNKQWVKDALLRKLQRDVQ